MKKYFLPPILIMITAILLSACASGTGTSSEIESTPEEKLLIAEGRLLPFKSLDLSFNVSGEVAEILVEDGQSVRQGQVLARLVESPEVLAALARAQQDVLLAQQALDDYLASADLNLAQGRLEVINARGRFNTARDNYTSSKSAEWEARRDEAAAVLKTAEDNLALLEANNGLLPADQDALEASLEAAQTALESAQSAVDALNLTASLPGTVVDIQVIPGQKVSGGELIMSLGDFSQWMIRTDSLTETEVVNVSLDQKVEVILDALPDVVLAGHVTNINERYEEIRGDITYSVTIMLDQSDARMRWGMTAAVYFLP